MKFRLQKDQMDCGPACLAMIASHYGKEFGLQYLRDHSFITREGVSLLGIGEAAQTIGFEAMAARLAPNDFDAGLLPCILHWNQNHFVVLHKISVGLIKHKLIYHIADPGHGFIRLSEEKFNQSWRGDNEKGIGLFLTPTDQFFEQQPPSEGKLSISYLFRYLTPHRSRMGWMLLLLFLGTVTSLVFPLLTQMLIDKGVSRKDLNMVSYILLAQLSFFFGNIVFGILRNWIMLTVGTLINIQIISDFLRKLLKLPIRFFDTKLMGDFNQRIQDHDRIEQFLTSQSLMTLFSIITFSVFFGFLWYYDYRILLVYLALTIISVMWSIFWMKKRKLLDYFRFQQKSENQQSIYEIINGVAEMKLNQFEEYKRQEWEAVQQRLFKVNVRILKLDQLQLSGFDLINQLKNILVTFQAASFVIQGHLTLGALLSVSYIIGQLSGPVGQLVIFFRSMQDARFSLSRLSEVQEHEEEEKEGLLPLCTSKNDGIYFNNVSFQYEGPRSPYVLKDIDIFIPEGSVTAIVGASGSGKTTLMKILLKFYDPVAGDIQLNQVSLSEISPMDLRRQVGVVMQDGFIFSDTIERNIVTGDREPNMQRLRNAVRIANIGAFIDELPLGIHTKIGASGSGLSGGQRQRILIARAVYKNPHFIFFDEATSALDAENEKIIHNNLQSFFKGKTVVIIAHRLSTVKNADQIIVLKRGEVVEKGSHEELVGLRSEYYHLVRNQLELGQ